MERREVTTAGRGGASRILVFAVDDAFFGLYLDGVEVVCPREAVALHQVKMAGGRLQPFFVYRGEPAFPVELRAVFSLPTGSGRGERPAYLVVRSGSYLLALQIDACVGVQNVDFSSTIPVATKLVGDGAVPVGHMIEADGAILVVLNPHRLVDGFTRDHLALALRAANEFEEREQSIEDLWAEIRTTPSVPAVRKYARLCKRNGHVKVARAARLILKHMADVSVTDSLNGGGETQTEQTLIGMLVQFACAGRSGDITVEAGGTDVGRVVMASGQFLTASCGDTVGRDALTQLLALPDTRPHVSEGNGEAGRELIADNPIALMIEALASSDGDRRPRRRE